MNNAKLRMSKSICLFIFLLVVSTSLIAQQSNNVFDRKNATYVEIGGSGVWYSLNYEHRIPVQINQRITLGGGLSVIPVGNSNLIGIVSSNYLIGRKNIFEVGISPAYIFTNSEFLLSARVGYQYESDKGFLFRVGFSPIFGKFNLAGSENGSKGVLPWGYLSFGYAF